MLRAVIFAFFVVAVPVRAQFLTCNDTVTVCIPGLETCCCPQPLVFVCSCCVSGEQCYNGTCAVPSMTPTRTPTPSPSPSQSPPGCTQVDGTTLSCSGSLDNTVVIVPVNVSTIVGDLLMENTTTLRITDSVTVNGTVVIAGTVEAVLTTPPTDPFVVLVTGESVVASTDTTVELTGPGVPRPAKKCEQISQTNEVRGGRQFGVLLETDRSGCGNGNQQQPGWWAYQIVLPVLVCFCCLCVCCTAIAVAVFWNRLRPLTWKRERDTFNDPIEASR